MVSKEVLITGGASERSKDGLLFEKRGQLREETGVRISLVEEDNLERWEEAEERVRRTDIIVVICDRPTAEGGIISGMGIFKNKPVVLVYPEGKRVSRMARGAPNVIAEVVYSSEEEMIETLKSVFEILGNIQGGKKRERLEVLLFSQPEPPSSLRPAANK